MRSCEDRLNVKKTMPTNFRRHDGALNMKVHVNGKEICSAEAIYGREGRIRMGPAVRRGRQLVTTLLVNPLTFTGEMR
jgi:hypothetical protein